MSDFFPRNQGFTYGRWDNPAVAIYEKRMAAVENTEAANATSFWIAAIFMFVHNLSEADDKIVPSNRIYGGTLACLMSVLNEWVLK